MRCMCGRQALLWHRLQHGRKSVPEEARELVQELKKLEKEKKEAIRNQDFENASLLRAQEKELEERVKEIRAKHKSENETEGETDVCIAESGGAVLVRGCWYRKYRFMPHHTIPYHTISKTRKHRSTFGDGAFSRPRLLVCDLGSAFSSGGTQSHVVL